jgi:apolipoprotein N-acyltransferase
VRFPALPPGAGWIIASGLLLGLAHPPLRLLFPSFVGLVPFAIWLYRLPEAEEGRTRAFRGGFWLGLIYYSLLLHWLASALIVYSPLAILAFVLTVGLLALLLAVAATGMHHVRMRLGWPLWVTLPIFWTAAEWLRANLGPLSFPWQGLGTTLAGFPSLIGAADLVGARGIGWWLALLNGLLATAFLAWRRRRARAVWLAVGGWLVALSVPVAYSSWRWDRLELVHAATVRGVQPNVPEDVKLEPAAAADSAVRSTETLLSRHDPGLPADLLILPETVFPGPIDPILAQRFAGRPDVYSWVASLNRRTGAAVLFGAIGVDNRGPDEWDQFNSAYLLDGRRRNRARYDKRRLVPAVERLPFLDPDWFGRAAYFGGFEAGRSADPLPLGAESFGVLICFESIFAELSRDYRRRGADFLVNITNDAWFGREGPWWRRTAALWQHPSHLTLRAIENRIGIARIANTGVSGTVDPLGRWRHTTRLFEPSIFTAELLTTEGLTLFARTGDVVGWLAALAAALGIAMPRVRHRPAPAGSGAAGGDGRGRDITVPESAGRESAGAD